LSVITLHPVTAENLTCVRGGRTVFRDLNFRFEPEQVVSLEGPNGSGKTSLLRMIAGFLAPESGHIRFAEVVDREQRGKLVGWLGHQEAVKRQMTPRETLRFYARLYGVRAAAVEKLCEHALMEVGLRQVADLATQYLSEGQRRRLAIARLHTFVIRTVWLLDEPLASLDQEGKSLLRALITKYRVGGGIVVAATHEPLGIDAVRLTLV